MVINFPINTKLHSHTNHKQHNQTRKTKTKFSLSKIARHNNMLCPIKPSETPEIWSNEYTRSRDSRSNLQTTTCCAPAWTFSRQTFRRLDWLTRLLSKSAARGSFFTDPLFYSALHKTLQCPLCYASSSWEIIAIELMNGCRKYGILQMGI